MVFQILSLSLYRHTECVSEVPGGVVERPRLSFTAGRSLWRSRRPPPLGGVAVGRPGQSVVVDFSGSLAWQF